VAKTYTAIQKIDVGAGGSSNFTFNSIPATYTDLWLAISSRMLAGGLNGGYASLVFNGDSGSNYGQQWLRGNINTGAVSASDNTTNSYILCLNNSVTNSNTTDVFSSSDIYISSYRSASAKQVSEYHTGAQGVELDAQKVLDDAKAVAKASAEAKLAALGLTAEEIAAL
jgi:hypothetical protein